MKAKEITINSKKVYDGKIIDVYQDEVAINQHHSFRELVNHPGGVCICAITDTDHIIVVSQYRYGAKDFLLELPAGKKEPLEDPLVTAKRELMEETGYQAHTFESYGVFYPSPAYLNEVIHLYVATDLEFVGQQLDDGEYLDVSFVPLDQLLANIKNHQITDGKTVALLLKVALVRNRL